MKLFISIIVLVGCLVYVGVIVFVVAPVALTPQDTEAVSREALDKINDYRAAGGLEALAWDNELAALATAHSQLLNDTNQLYHSTLPYAENVLKGGFRLEGGAIADEWRKSPAHYIIMMGGQIQRGAVGVAGEYATFMAR